MAVKLSLLCMHLFHSRETIIMKLYIFHGREILIELIIRRFRLRGSVVINESPMPTDT